MAIVFLGGFTVNRGLNIFVFAWKAIVLENLVLKVFYSLLGLAFIILAMSGCVGWYSVISLFWSLLAAWFWFDDWHGDWRLERLRQHFGATTFDFALHPPSATKCDPIQAQTHWAGLTVIGTNTNYQLHRFLHLCTHPKQHSPTRKYPHPHNMWMRTKLYSLVHRENRIITEIIKWRCRLGSFDDSVTRDGDPTN